jgi:hypothetical protein
MPSQSGESVNIQLTAADRDRLRAARERVDHVTGNPISLELVAEALFRQGLQRAHHLDIGFDELLSQLGYV